MTRCAPMTIAPMGEPFATVEEAVFWAVPALIARHEGVRFVAGMGDLRPCEPMDMQVILAGLIRSRRLVAMHVKAVMQFGQIGWPPSPHSREESRFVPWWDEALDRMYGPLVAKGIVLARQSA